MEPPPFIEKRVRMSSNRHDFRVQTILTQMLEGFCWSHWFCQSRDRRVFARNPSSTASLSPGTRPHPLPKLPSSATTCTAEQIQINGFTRHPGPLPQLPLAERENRSPSL